MLRITTAIVGVFVFLFLLAVPSFAADIVINEIMYDLPGTDTDREWIEIYNKGTNAVDLINWRFQEGGTKHILNSYQGGLILSPSGYAIIVDSASGFLGDHPGFSGIIIDSSFSLSNAGESLVLLESVDATTYVDEVSYQSSWGGAGNSGSLERKDVAGASNDSSNWQESVVGGSSGFANSAGATPTPSPTPAPTLSPTPTPTASPTPTPSLSPTTTPRPTTAASTTSTPKPTSTSSPTSAGTTKVTTVSTAASTPENLVLGVTDVSSTSANTEEGATAGSAVKEGKGLLGLSGKQYLAGGLAVLGALFLGVSVFLFFKEKASGKISRTDESN